MSVDNNSRFSDCGNGTVTDTQTGLIWLKDAGCLGGTGIPYAQAFQLASTLQNGTCGLTDGSSAGDWSLPGVQEIKSLFAPSAQACVPDIMGSGGVFCLNVGTPWASNLQVEYWTVNPAATGGFVMFSAWLANVNSGTFSAVSKAAGLGNVWPVRGNMKQTCNTAAFGGTC